MNEDGLKNRGFSARKLALLATLLDEEGIRQTPALKRIARNGELPLSSAQMRLWLFDQLEPGSSAYSIPVRHDFKGPFDIAAFEHSLSEIVRRHEVLRTGYLRVDGRPVQRIAPAERLRIHIVDLQSDLQDLPEAAREQKAASLASAFARQPFDLGKAPLLRAQVLKLAPDDHVLLLNVHHIAFDWWSMGVFENELAPLYEAFLRGEKVSPLPDLPLQYVDFTAWQQERLQEEILQEQVDYWRTKLSGELPTLELPTDHPRPAIQTYNGTFVCSALSNQLTEALKTLSQRERTTLFATLLGAFKVLLQRYTGEDDILVGVPIAARNRAEIEGLIGFFVNTLVLRTDLSGDPTFRQFLGRVQETTLGAYAHQNLPFEKLVEVLNPKRDSSRSPMFQVMLSMLNTPMQPLQLSRLQHRRTMLDSGTSKFDLTLYAIEEPTGLSFTCEYNTDLFHADRIQRMLGHLEVLLEGIVDDSDRRLSELPLLTKDERQEVLVSWNDTRAEYPQDVALHQLFEAQAEKTPEALAVEYGGAQLTYSELNQRANQLAHHLRTQGVASETLVGICMERSLEMVIALLAILKAGGAYVPLDPAYPKERLAFMMEDAQVRLLLTGDGVVTGLSCAKTVRMDSDAEEIARQSDANPTSMARSSNLAYVIYTSGSTGKSKGVQISHRSVVNFLTSMRQQPGLAEEDVLLSVTTLSFDIAALEIFLPLTVGARLVLVSREAASDGARLSEQLATSGATVMQATPATWRLLLEAGWEGSHRLKILCGGEALDRELANQLLKKCAALWNLYGPTETTIWSATYKVESESESKSESETGPVPIGRPIANTQLYLLDRHLQPVPVGVTGELHIGGDGLARGYLNRPELTTEKFVPNPFSDDSEAPSSNRLYKTGDLARYLPSGSIDFLGRNDYQVKIRGFRIELGEIEAALALHPSVQKAVVLAREDGSGEKRLVAYIVAKHEQTAPVDALRNFLKEKLPAHMVPAFFVVMENLPLTPNGKIDRKALPSPEHAAVGTGFLAPRDPLEQMLAQIWSKVLKVKRIGIRDNFFELGGHSLLAVRIMAEIERLLQRRLPLATFLQAPTIGELADVLRKKDWKPSWSSLVPIRAGGSKPPLFLMHSHGGNVLEYYPLAESLGADQPVYALQARGLDGHIIKDQSFEEMVEAHLAELRSLQPEGPYFLGGYCLGGLLALEAARQLSAVGEEVGLVVLIQTINPTYARFSPDLTLMHRAWYRAIKRIDLELAYLHHRGGNHIVERCRRTWDVAVAKTAITFDNWRDQGHGQRNGHRRGTSMAHTLGLLAIEHERARSRYKLRPYSGPVLLFRANRQVSGLMADSNLGWKDVLTGKLAVCEVSGHQETMLLEPNVSYIAKELTAQLQAVQHSPVAT